MNRKVEITVGLFMVLVICSVLFLCFKVTDPTTFTNKSTYRVYAIFDNIGGLKARSPVKIGGVVIGRVGNIELNNYKPYVAIDIEQKYDRIPSGSSLSIKTSGVLGEQFIDLNLAMEQDLEKELDDLDAMDRGIATSDSNQNNIPDYLQEGFVIEKTTPAVILEDLIGKFMYSLESPKKDDKAVNSDQQ